MNGAESLIRTLVDGGVEVQTDLLVRPRRQRQGAPGQRDVGRVVVHTAADAQFGGQGCAGVGHVEDEGDRRHRAGGDGQELRAHRAGVLLAHPRSTSVSGAAGA